LHTKLLFLQALPYGFPYTEIVVHLLRGIPVVPLHQTGSIGT